MQLERAYVERLLLWGAASLVAGTAMLAMLAVWRARSPLLMQFGLQTLVWGFGTLAVASWHWHRIPLRDLAAATELDHLLWFFAGLDVGVVLAGAALAVTALILPRRQGLLGAALAVIVQGAALFVIHGRLMAALRV